MKKNSLRLGIVLTLVMLLMTGCVPGDGAYTAASPAGFFWGIWHGWIAPVSLIIGLFDKNIRVYEVYNTGWWYDFGFYIAIISGFGSLSLFRKKKSGGKH
jgi:hypothetical protein